MTSYFRIPALNKSCVKIQNLKICQMQANDHLDNHAGTISFRILFYSANQCYNNNDLISLIQRHEMVRDALAHILFEQHHH